MNMGVLRWELASWRGAAWLPVRRKRKARERCVDFIVESSVYCGWILGCVMVYSGSCSRRVARNLVM
jgi:hypothetical protein